MITDVLASPWRKSHHSNPNGACVELAAGTWRKSSHCPNDYDCVEVGDGVMVRDTTFATRGEVSPVLRFSPEAWRQFTDQIRGS